MDRFYADLSDREREWLGWSEDQRTGEVRRVLTPWHRYALSYDPQPVLEQVRCPVLALFGEKDLQVSAKENLQGVKRALSRSGNRDFVVRELQGLNHLFQEAKTGAESEYIEIEETISPSVLELITAWIKERSAGSTASGTADL
jgi:fermentation-respiration switch protein FrsA (DUF1100 family)